MPRSASRTRRSATVACVACVTLLLTGGAARALTVTCVNGTLSMPPLAPGSACSYAPDPASVAAAIYTVDDPSAVCTMTPSADFPNGLTQVSVSCMAADGTMAGDACWLTLTDDNASVLDCSGSMMDTCGTVSGDWPQGWEPCYPVVTSCAEDSSGTTYTCHASVVGRSTNRFATCQGTMTQLTGPPSLSISTRGASAVAGGTIAFTVTLANSSAPCTGTATGVLLADPLPSGTDLSWSIDAASTVAPAGVTCSITGVAPAQVLNCGTGATSTGPFDLPPGASVTVRVKSGSTQKSCGQYPDTATGSATNSAAVADSATAAVICPCAVGYPYASTNPRTSVVFNESDVLRTYAPNIAGPGDTIKLWYNDEHALTLGVRQVVVKTKTGTTTTSYSITKLPSDPGSALNPDVGSLALDGDQAGTDGSTCAGSPDLCDRPMYPALFITDVTNKPTNTSGDWQWGGTPIPPHAVFGSWKGAVRTVNKTTNPTQITVTPDANPAKNHWNLSSGSDAPAAGFTPYKNEGYGAEVRWNVNDLGLQPGHIYRVQFMVHDGDQNKAGGDSGQACITVALPD